MNYLIYESNVFIVGGQNLPEKDFRGSFDNIYCKNKN